MRDKITFWCFTHSHPLNYEFYANFIILAMICIWQMFLMIDN